MVCGQTWEREPPSTPAKTMLGLLKKFIVLSYYSYYSYYVFRRRKYTLEIWSSYVKSVTHKIGTSLFLFKIGPSGVRLLPLGIAVKLSSLHITHRTITFLDNIVNPGLQLLIFSKNEGLVVTILAWHRHNTSRK